MNRKGLHSKKVAARVFVVAGTFVLYHVDGPLDIDGSAEVLLTLIRRLEQQFLIGDRSDAFDCLRIQVSSGGHYPSTYQQQRFTEKNVNERKLTKNCVRSTL